MVTKARENAADDPRGFIFFRPGQVSLLMRPLDEGNTPPLTADDLSELAGLLAGAGLNITRARDPFHANPFRRLNNEPGPGAAGNDRRLVVMRRGPDLGVRVLQSANLASWHPGLDREGNVANLRSPIQDVGTVVNWINGQINQRRDRGGAPIMVGPAYHLDAISPTWLGMPF